MKFTCLSQQQHGYFTHYRGVQRNNPNQKKKKKQNEK